MKNIAAFFFLILSTITSHIYSKNKIDTTVTLTEGKKTVTYSLTILPRFSLVMSMLNTLATQHSIVLKTATRNSLDQTINELTILLNMIKKNINLIKTLQDATHKTSLSIPPISYTQEKKILNIELKNISKQINTIKKEKKIIPKSLINHQNLLITKIKELDIYTAADKKKLKKASKNYIILSNALKQRLHIYAAPRKYPNNFGKKPIKSISPKKSVYLLACQPDLIYKIKIRNQYGKIKRGKIIYNYHTLHRANSKIDTFSSKDKNHQLIINNYHRYSIHSTDYEGKGSIQQHQNQTLAIIISTTIVVGLFTGAIGAWIGCFAAGAATSEALLTACLFQVATPTWITATEITATTSGAILGAGAVVAPSATYTTKENKNFNYKNTINQKPTTPPPTPYSPVSVQE